MGTRRGAVLRLKQQIRPSDQLLEPQNSPPPGSILVYLEPLYDGMADALRVAQPAALPCPFQDWCLADTFFAPVATRTVTYSLPLSPEAQDYRDTVLAHPWASLPILSGWSLNRCATCVHTLGTLFPSWLKLLFI